eukprot:3302905-Amphidinium_carterae.1
MQNRTVEPELVQSCLACCFSILLPLASFCTSGSVYARHTPRFILQLRRAIRAVSLCCIALAVLGTTWDWMSLGFACYVISVGGLPCIAIRTRGFEVTAQSCCDCQGQRPLEHCSDSACLMP